MNAIICGDRNWTNEELIRDVITTLGITLVINGACRGADKLSSKVAKDLGVHFIEYPADWKLYGKSAGPTRNKEMLECEIETLELVIGFHNNLEKSKGTRHMMEIAKDAGIVTVLITE